MGCENLQKYLDGALEGQETMDFRFHITRCDDCREAFAEHRNGNGDEPESPTEAARRKRLSDYVAATDVAPLLQELKERMSATVIAAECGCSTAAIYNILNGSTQTVRPELAAKIRDLHAAADSESDRPEPEEPPDDDSVDPNDDAAGHRAPIDPELLCRVVSRRISAFQDAVEVRRNERFARLPILGRENAFIQYPVPLTEQDCQVIAAAVEYLRVLLAAQSIQGGS